MREDSHFASSILTLYVEGFERLRTKLGVFRSSLLVIHFNLKSQIFDHAPDFWGRLAW